MVGATGARRGTPLAWRGPVRRVLSNRFVHFGVIGAALFAAVPAPTGDREIAIGPERVAAVAAVEARRLGVSAPGTQLVREVTARLVEDELLYREGLRLALDRYDAIVRARIIQKVRALAEEAGAQPATDDGLRRYFAREGRRWRRSATADYEHVFLRGVCGEKARRLRARAAREANPAGMGGPFPLPRRGRGQTEAAVAAQLGAVVAHAVFETPLRQWSEPVASAYGCHLVRVVARTAERDARFEEVRPEVALAYEADRRARAMKAYVERLRRAYTVSVRQPEAGS